MKSQTVSSLILCLLLLISVLVILSVMAGGSTSAQGTAHYVVQNGFCGDVSPCYPTIQAAVEAAVDGDVIKVAQGVYTSTGLSVVYISNAITVTGGYTTSDWTHSFPITQPTVIDAEDAIRRRGMVIQGTSQTTITLRALTIQRGNARDNSAGGGGIYIASGTTVLENSRVLSNTTGGTGSGSCGGGIFLASEKLILHDTLLQGNSAPTGNGAGICTSQATKLILVGNTFQGNNGVGLFVDRPSQGFVHVELHDNTFRANRGSGAWLDIASALLVDNVFEANSDSGLFIRYGEVFAINNTFLANEAQHGGGMHAAMISGLIQGNEFQLNSATHGGGAYVAPHLGQTIIMSSNIFTGNVASDYGGGIYIGAEMFFSPGKAILRGNKILNNFAGLAAGGLAVDRETVLGSNDIIAHNTSPAEGVFVFSDGIVTSTLAATHWTLADNGSYALTTDGGTAILTNTIVVTHSFGGFAGLDISADHTLFFNSGVPCSSGALCTNNLMGDPDFVHPESWEYHIGPGSAAIDQGVNTSVHLDIDHQPRPYQAPDLGADEYWPPGVLQHAYLPLLAQNARLK